MSETEIPDTTLVDRFYLPKCRGFKSKKAFTFSMNCAASVKIQRVGYEFSWAMLEGHNVSKVDSPPTSLELRALNGDAKIWRLASHIDLRKEITPYQFYQVLFRLQGGIDTYVFGFCRSPRNQELYAVVGAYGHKGVKAWKIFAGEASGTTFPRKDWLLATNNDIQTP